MIWAEVAAAAVGGVAGGWLAHWGYARLRPVAAATAVPVPPFSGGEPGPRVELRSDDRPRAIDVRPDRTLTPGATTAARVIRHLGSLGRLPYDEVAPIGFTQRGISEAVGLRQGTLAKALARLAAADVVEVRRGHVRGEPRRLKIYRLTSLGESLARDLRRGQASPEAASFPVVERRV